MTTVNLSRRGFLKASAVTGGSLVVGFTAGVSLAAAGSENLQPNAFIEITRDGDVIFHCPRDEMGQGVDTGLATLIAEELDVDPATITVRRPTADWAFANPDFNLQVTGGSTAIKAHFLPLRQAAANTRALLLEAAARDLGVPASELRTDSAAVVDGAGQRHSYGAFVATAAELAVPEAAALKAHEDFKYIGREFPRLDGLAKATGTAQFGVDVDLPGMHRAVVVRCPVAGGSVKRFDASAAKARAGVTDVVEIDAGIAVVAPHYWQAKQAAADLEIDWDLPPLAAADTATVKTDFEAALASEEGVETAVAGDVDEGLATARVTVESEYWAPYLAHAPMEPMNAVVRINGDSAEVWSGTQAPVADQGLVARALDIDKDKVTVHATYMGGGFGRRATLTHVTEAAQIARATGKPIQVLWSREDDLRHGVYRPASLMRLRAGVDADGTISGWEATRVGGNMMPTTIGNQMPALAPGFVPDGFFKLAVSAASKAYSDWTVDHSSIEGLHEDYDLPNRKVRHITVDHGLPLTFWRSVGHSYTAFAKETLVDELAESADIDPVDLRLRNTRNNPRLANVIRIAGEHARAARSRAQYAVGVAAHGSFDTYVAQVAEVSVDNGSIRVHNVTCVVDCGQVINPDIVRAQMEGSIMFGLTAALHGNLNLKDGAIIESNFHDYPILRMNEAPAVNVVIVDSDEAPTGVGEPGLPPIAPAVANAVYAATGQRLRSLPLSIG